MTGWFQASWDLHPKSQLAIEKMQCLTGGVQGGKETQTLDQTAREMISCPFHPLYTTDFSV